MPLFIATATGVAAFGGAAGVMWMVQKSISARRAAAQAAEAARIRRGVEARVGEIVQRGIQRGEERKKKMLEEQAGDLAESEEVLRSEDGLLNERTSQLDKRANGLNRREEALKAHRQEMDVRRQKLDEGRQALGKMQRGLVDRLAERLSSTPDAFLAQAVDEYVEQAGLSIQKHARLVDQDLTEAAEKMARKWMTESIQRLGFHFVKEAPSGFFLLEHPKHIEQMADGRFAQLYTELTGVPTEWQPDAGRLFFNINHPYKKELAKRTIKQVAESDQFKAILDDPKRLEPLLERTERSLLKFMSDETRRVIKVLGFKPNDFSPELQRYMGLLKFRFSFLQNIVDHSLEVAYLSAMLGDELGLDTMLSRRAGYLHDLGKSIDYEVEGTHPQLGEELAKKLGEPEAVWMAAGHHHDDEPENVYAAIAKAADAISAARPGARKDKGDFFSDRIAGLERICREPSEVNQVSIMNAGREVRVFVDSTRLDDQRAEALGNRLAEQIEDELTYPGQVQIVVIRESRTTAVAH